MRTKTNYEWDIEELDPAQVREGTPAREIDILDHDFRDRLKEFSDESIRRARVGTTHRLVLVRSVWDDDYGTLWDRSWAYVEDGTLPSHFTNSDGHEDTSVPKRFAKEFSMAFGPCRVRPEHISEEWSEESSGDGYWISLRPGWSLSDDAVHCIHEYTKTEAHRRFIRRCDCKSCRFWEPAS